MYSKVSEIGWDNPMQPKKQKCDFPTEKLQQNRDAVMNSDAIVSQFWQVWQEIHDRLYRCCLKMMNFNRADAEDTLSRAMLKAWEKGQKFGREITNLKAWLYQLTRNFCLDVIREHSRGAAGVESIEWVGNTEEMSTAARVECPESVLEREERSVEIQKAIASLPERFRETFILHFYQERSHQEIARDQGISYDNVCKRISLARKILKEKLSDYFQGGEPEIVPQSTPKRQKSKILTSNKTQKNEILPPKPDNVPEEVKEKPQTVIEKESRKQEKKEISEPFQESETRSRSVELPNSTTEEKGSIERLEETGKESARSLKLMQKKQSQPQKTKPIAIAIPPSKRNREGKKRSLLLKQPISLLMVTADRIGRAIARFREIWYGDRASSFFSKNVECKFVKELDAIAPMKKENFPSRSPPKIR